MRSVWIALSGAAVAVLLAAGVAGPAAAHTALTGVDPAEGTTVAAGDAVTLTFSEDILAVGAEATVTDAGGAPTALEVTFPTAASIQVVLPEMQAGAVSLAWRIVADDGHPIEGTLAYTADAPPVVTPSPTPVVTPSATPAASETPSASASPAASGTESGAPANSGLPPALWIAIAASVLASSAAIIAAKRRS